MIKTIAFQLAIGFIWGAIYLYFGLIPFENAYEHYVHYFFNPPFGGEARALHYIEYQEASYFDYLILLAWFFPIALVWNAADQAYSAFKNRK